MSFDGFKKITSINGETELDSQKDIRKYTEAVEKDPKALRIMTDYQKGIVYFFICGDLRDEEKALRLLKKAADSGLPKAMYMYGFACHHMSLNCGSDTNRKKRLEKEYESYMYKALKNGNADAIILYGKGYLNSKDNPEHVKIGEKLLEEAAGKGSAEAKRYLRIYRNKIHYDFPERDIPEDRVITTLVEQIVARLPNVNQETGCSIWEIITDEYSGQGYQWVNYDEFIGTIFTRNLGNSFLITEDELWDVYFELMDYTDGGHCLEWRGQNGLPYEVPVCLKRNGIDD